MMCTGDEETWPPKADEPCEAYFGNVCSGFGGSLTCDRCGWERHEHPGGGL